MKVTGVAQFRCSAENRTVSSAEMVWASSPHTSRRTPTARRTCTGDDLVVLVTRVTAEPPAADLCSSITSVHHRPLTNASCVSGSPLIHPSPPPQAPPPPSSPPAPHKHNPPLVRRPISIPRPPRPPHTTTPPAPPPSQTTQPPSQPRPAHTDSTPPPYPAHAPTPPATPQPTTTHTPSLPSLPLIVTTPSPPRPHPHTEIINPPLASFFLPLPSVSSLFHSSLTQRS